MTGGYSQFFAMWASVLAYLEKAPEKNQRLKYQQKDTSKMEVMVYYNLILEETYHHICLSLFIRSKSLGLAYTQKERLHMK